MREIPIPCPGCGGGGILGYVSRDMALDACEPSMEGMPIPCGRCNGGGCVGMMPAPDDEKETPR